MRTLNLSGYAQRRKVYQQQIPDSQTLVNKQELDAYFKIGSTYASNALEGNSLTLEETKVLLEDGITVGGKPIRDHYEATGHAAAYEYMLSIARSGDIVFTADMLRKLHRLFYSGIDSERAGCYRDHQVFITGTDYLPPLAEDVPGLMDDFINELNTRKDTTHPILFAAYAHKRFVDIHPFADGNGRTARLLMNLILVSKGYCVVSISPIWRHEYIQALIAESILEAQRDYIRMLRIPLANVTPSSHRHQ